MEARRVLPRPDLRAYSFLALVSVRKAKHNCADHITEEFVMETALNKECVNCHGTAKDPVSRKTCTECSGSGRQLVNYESVPMPSPEEEETDV